MININEKLSKFSNFMLDSAHFQHIQKTDRESIVILAKLVFIDEIENDLIPEILAEKYLKEVN